MRRLMKRVAAAVLTAACLFSLSACSAKQDETAAQETLISTEGTVVEDAMGESIKLSAAQTLGGNTEQLVIQKSLLEAQGDVMGAELYAKQIEIRQELGELKDIDLEAAQVLLLADGSYTVTMPVTFAEGTMQYVLNLNLATPGDQKQVYGYVIRQRGGSVYRLSAGDCIRIFRHRYRHGFRCPCIYQPFDLLL